MKFNLYRLDAEFNLVNEDQSTLNIDIKKRLETIESEIIDEYLRAQQGKLGIKKLGNEIRYNPVLKEEFNSLKEGKVIFKMTENKRAFIKVFIDNWIDFSKDQIFYFVLENQFGTTSKLVDNSFIRLNDIREELSRFYKHFKPTNSGPQIFIVEMKGFSDYYIVDNEGYSSIHK